MNNDGRFVEDRSRHNIRPIRDRHAPVRYGDPVIDYDYSPDQCFTMCSLDYIYNVKTVPRTYRQALLSDEKPQWAGAIDKEFNTLVKTKTFIIVDRPAAPGPILTNRWVLSRKVDPDGQTVFKARLCARGFQQEWVCLTMTPMLR